MGALENFAFTHVQYESFDRIGYFLAFSTLSPVFLTVAYVTAFSVRREIVVATTFLGQLLNEALNWACKRVIKEERPTS